MNFETELETGTIIKRYKRFLSDIELENGEVITAHTPNTGSMKTCWEPGWKVAVSKSNNPNRKLPYTLEMTHNGDTWIAVNTGLPNKLAVEAIKNGTIIELQGYQFLKPEKKVGKSRIDIYLSDDEKNPTKQCYVEVKNVTLLGKPGKALFPDGVSARGLKHLEELIDIKKQGHRACMLFVVSRMDVNEFGPAFSFDPSYSEKLVEAQKAGVEIIIYQCEISKQAISLKHKIPLKIDLND